DAVHGTDLGAARVLGPDARLADHIGHGELLPGGLFYIRTVKISTILWFYKPECVNCGRGSPLPGPVRRRAGPAHPCAAVRPALGTQARRRDGRARRASGTA